MNMNKISQFNKTFAYPSDSKTSPATNDLFHCFLNIFWGLFFSILHGGLVDILQNQSEPHLSFWAL